MIFYLFLLIMFVYTLLLLLSYFFFRKDFIIVTSFDCVQFNESDKYTYYNISNCNKCIESGENFHFILITPMSLIFLLFCSSENFTKFYFYNNRKLYIQNDNI